jgi:hypothetical protein
MGSEPGHFDVLDRQIRFRIYGFEPHVPTASQQAKHQGQDNERAKG